MLTVITPSLRLAIWENSPGDMSKMRPALLPSRSSTTQVVEAPLATLVTCSTVPNESDGLAQPPGMAEPYQVASPVDDADVTGAGGGGGGGAGAVVVVVVGGGGGAVVVVVGAGAGGAVVVVVVVGAGAGSVVVVVGAAAAWASATFTMSSW
jgi:hypothetical protein